MNAPAKKDTAPPPLPAKPTGEELDPKAAAARTLARFPKIMAALAR